MLTPILSVTGVNEFAETKRLGERSLDLLGEEVGLPGVGFRQHDHEFVAALARQHVMRADEILQHDRNADEQFIAHRMAERVVHVLEIVDVDEQKCGALAAVGAAVIAWKLSRIRNRLGRPVSASK